MSAPVPAPAPGTPPAGQFALSAPFERLLEEFTIEQPDPNERATYVVHEPCLGTVRTVEEDMTMAVLLHAVVTHTC